MSTMSTCCVTRSIVCNVHDPRHLSRMRKNCTMKTTQPIIFNANGIVPNQERMPQDQNYPLNWAQQEKVEASAGFKYQDGKVYIVETGYYFVQSQIKLGRPLSDTDIDAGHCANNTTSVKYYLKIKHYSYKRQEGTVLLENVRYNCIRNCQQFKVTISSGVASFLEKGDHVYVVTSHPGHIMPSAEDNRFSVFRIY